ncbi:hypothetical protein BACIT_1862 [Bacillus amyloliquefaciens]|nr:hypothetical protein BACIT_1862 [Bacillus amyloliquefaciens]
MTFVMFGGRMLIRRHIEGFFIRDKAGHFISALLKKRQQKRTRPVFG